MEGSEPAQSERITAAVWFAVSILLAVGLVASMVADEALHHGISQIDLALWITGSWILRLLAAYFAVRQTPDIRCYARVIWPLAVAELLAAGWLARPGMSGYGWNPSLFLVGASLSAGFSLCLFGLWLAVKRSDGSTKPSNRPLGAKLIAAGIVPGAAVILFAIGMSRR